MLIAGLAWLDQHRSGPATTLSRCNLLLSKHGAPAADVLVIGSSRTGTAVDPVLLAQLLDTEVTRASVERLALGESPLRASQGLLDNYLSQRGTPKIIVLELMVLTERSLNRLSNRGISLSPEEYLFRRDINLLTFSQLWQQRAVAMPYTRQESRLDLWQLRLRGLALRAGALSYEFLRAPLAKNEMADCSVADWTREPTWPADFAFSYGDYEATGDAETTIAELTSEMENIAADKRLSRWQEKTETGVPYPYDFSEPYRSGEVRILADMLQAATQSGARVLLLPLTLYGTSPAASDLEWLSNRLPAGAEVFDLYAATSTDLSRFWYDDGHLEPDPAGALTTATLARRLLEKNLLMKTAADEP